MKDLKMRFFSLLFSAVLAFSLLCPVMTVSAQEDPMVMTASFGGLYDSFLEYQYNAQGQVTVMTNRSTKEVTKYEYHPSGCIKKESVLYYNKVTRIREYDYNGNLTGTAHMDEYGNKVYDKRCSNKYDDQGRLIYFMMQSEEFHREEATFFYHSDGSFIVEWESYDLYEGRKLPYMHRIGHFTPEGYQTYQLIDLEYGREHLDTWTTVLDQHGNPIIHTSLFDVENITQATLTRYENQYDSQGRLLSRKTYTASKDTDYEQELIETLVYTYDSQGRKVKTSGDQYQMDGAWEYDSQGNLMSSAAVEPVCSDLDMFMMRNDGVWPRYCETQYEYMPLSKALRLSGG